MSEKSKRANWRGVLMLTLVLVLAAQPGSEKFMFAVWRRSLQQWITEEMFSLRRVVSLLGGVVVVQNRAAVMIALLLLVGGCGFFSGWVSLTIVDSRRAI